METFSAVHLLVEVAATIAFAASGLVAAARKRLDAFGVCIVTGVAAFGGGTLRDILLDKRPFFWVQHSGWLWGLLALCALAMVLMRSSHLALTEKAIQIPDAFGLGLFSALGTSIASQAGMPAVVAVLMGITTAVFGGVLRDILCNELPKAFVDHQPYAVLAFIGGWIVLALEHLQQPEWICLLIASALTTALRLFALRLGWRLPEWQVGHRGSDKEM